MCTFILSKSDSVLYATVLYRILGGDIGCLYLAQHVYIVKVACGGYALAHVGQDAVLYQGLHVATVAEVGYRHCFVEEALQQLLGFTA